MICRVAQSTRHSLTFVCLFVSTTGLAFAYLPIHDMVPIFLFTLLKRCIVNKSMSRNISITHETTVGYGTILGCRAAAGVWYQLWYGTYHT